MLTLILWIVAAYVALRFASFVANEIAYDRLHREIRDDARRIFGHSSHPRD